MQTKETEKRRPVKRRGGRYKALLIISLCTFAVLSSSLTGTVLMRRHEAENAAELAKLYHAPQSPGAQEVTVGIRPEGFVLSENGPLKCHISNIEVMGRDMSVVSTHPASLNASVRSIIDADHMPGLQQETVRYAIKPHKIFVFAKETEERIRFEVK